MRLPVWCWRWRWRRSLPLLLLWCGVGSWNPSALTVLAFSIAPLHNNNNNKPHPDATRHLFHSNHNNNDDDCDHGEQPMKRTKKELFPFQQEGVQRLVADRRLLLADEVRRFSTRYYCTTRERERVGGMRCNFWMENIMQTVLYCFGLWCGNKSFAGKIIYIYIYEDVVPYNIPQETCCCGSLVLCFLSFLFFCEIVHMYSVCVCLCLYYNRWDWAKPCNAFKLSMSLGKWETTTPRMMMMTAARH